MESDTRPKIELITTGAELRQWYWLKSELIEYARTLGIRCTGAKFDILSRIAHYLDTGDKTWPGDQRIAPKSKMDWHSAPLDLDTVITDSYKNSQNARRFFKSQLGENFKFNIAFMKWMRDNVGKTLGDAVAAYQEQKSQAQNPDFQSEIAKHNQFNQYTRDFLADNPNMGLKDVRFFWALNRQQKSASGRHIYARADLKLGTPP